MRTTTHKRVRNMECMNVDPRQRDVADLQPAATSSSSLLGQQCSAAVLVRSKLETQQLSA